MTRYIGSGSYCYANSLAMVTGGNSAPPSAIEVLTGSPYGAQIEPSGLPYFDPPGWNPDLGLDAAVDLLGWTCERSAGGSPDEALDRLRAASGPALVGPVDIGLLRHQPWAAGTAIGGDHWVVVLEVTDDVVVMHDPDGFPYATLPIDSFLQAWRAEKLDFSAPHVLRTHFRRVRDVRVEDAVRASLPAAVSWLANGDSAGAVHRLAGMLAAGIDDDLQRHLSTFAVRSGARRLDDAATWLASIGEAEAAVIARDQSTLLGRLQYPLVVGEFSQAAETLRQLAPGYRQLLTALG
ncbi:hypothetical protein EV137_0373 [Kribbella pratensis]|uniref:Uncharacterized protein n=1 Tax=Kribbella pratensis TaxID=2512112 RepID=A0ABY2FJH1_9ACTN|nr:hypothetical protein EV137_0373 [Kribbella pratensis]